MANIALGNVTIDRDRFEVWVEGRRVELTFIEFELLYELVRHAGSVLSRQRLVRSIWHEPFADGDRKLTVHLSRLRQKLRGSRPWAIRTYAKRGYAFTNALPVPFGEQAPAGAPSLAGLAVAAGFGWQAHHVTAILVFAVAIVALLLAQSEGAEGLSGRPALAWYALPAPLIAALALKAKLGSLRVTSR